MTYLYGQPENRFAIVTGVMTVSSPRQAMLMERVMVKAMAEYAGKPEETLLALWHREAVSMRARAIRDNWRGWEDQHPVEHYPTAAKDNADG